MMERHEDDPVSNSPVLNAVADSFQDMEVRDPSATVEDSDLKILDGFEMTNGQYSTAKTEPALEESIPKQPAQAAECNGDQCEDVGYLKQLLQQNRLALAASEELAAELRKSLLDAEKRAENLSMDLSEAQSRMSDELTTRDKKYAELDNKFLKLQKRAKQRIQEMQKEKEDVEAQLAASSERTSQALSQYASLQHELERVRAQAGDALRTLDAERQQLRIANNKQKEIIEDLQRKIEIKDRECEETHRMTFEKEQVVNELTDKLMEVEEKQGAVIAELALKHQKEMEDLHSQLAETVHERTKSSETITSLQIQLAQKEAHIAELDAASSGEVIRLTASLEAVRGELVRVDQEHRKELKTWDSALEAMKLKLEENEKLYLQHQIQAEKEKSQMESEIQGIRQALNVAEAERNSAMEQVVRLEKDFSAYKVRAYSLLQKKEAELSAAKDAELLASQEAALKEAQRAAITATAEKDRAVRALQDAVAEHESQLAARSVALLDAEQKIRELAAKLESAKARIILEQDACQSRIDEINAEWEEKYNALQLRNATYDQLQKEFVALKENSNRLKEEHEAFQQLTNKMLESKDKEIAHLLQENREMERDIDSFKVSGRVALKEQADDISISSFEVGEQQILILARQQAQREEELAQCQRHIHALQDEIVELEHENRLHAQQEAALKEELRNLERSKKREGVDMTYLKNVILKLLETGEVEALLPVVAMLLQFSPDEMRKCQEVYNLVPETSLAASSDGSRTLLSRFLFSKAGK